MSRDGIAGKKQRNPLTGVSLRNLTLTTLLKNDEESFIFSDQVKLIF